MRMKTNVLVLLLLAVSAAASHAETSIRCHSKVISVGDSKAEVLLKCGEPMLKESIGTIEESKRIGLPLTSTSGIAAENADPVVIRRKETVSKTVDQWTYHQGAGKLLKILIFEGAELVEITTGGRT